MKDPYTFYSHLLDLFTTSIEANYDKKGGKLKLLEGTYKKERDIEGVTSFTIDRKEREGEVSIKGMHVCTLDDRKRGGKVVDCSRTSVKAASLSSHDEKKLERSMNQAVLDSIEAIGTGRLVPSSTRRHYPELATFLAFDLETIEKSEFVDALVKRSAKVIEKRLHGLPKKSSILAAGNMEKDREFFVQRGFIHHLLRELQETRKEEDPGTIIAGISLILKDSLKGYKELVDPQSIMPFISSKEDIGRNMYSMAMSYMKGIEYLYNIPEGNSMQNLNLPSMEKELDDQGRYHSIIPWSFKNERLFFLNLVRGIGWDKVEIEIHRDLSVSPAIMEKFVSRNNVFPRWVMESGKPTFLSRELNIKEYVKGNRKEDYEKYMQL